MTWQIIYTEQYNRRAARFLRNHPDLATVYAKTLELVQAQPYHPSLRLHALRGNLKGLHSVSINLSYRITIEFVLAESEIVPINVGSHDQVY
jgi:mRNA-degrading endonuclease YafQ of YafQ-DinJ toxin-antitoxin module